MSEAIAIDAGARPWSLAVLADPAEFDRQCEAAATAIADRFALKVHINVEARQRAFADWIDRVRVEDRRPPDFRVFVAVCAALIAALAVHRVFAYSAMVDAGDRMTQTVLKYGNEATALAVGAAIYALAVEDLTGANPAEPLPALVVENATAALRKQPEAAIRFRELLRLSTPWV